MSDRDLPDFTSERMQSEAEALGKHLATRGLGALERGALGAYMAGAAIGLNLKSGRIDEATAERMLQQAFQQMRMIAFGGRDRRN